MLSQIKIHAREKKNKKKSAQPGLTPFHNKWVMEQTVHSHRHRQHHRQESQIFFYLFVAWTAKQS